MNEQTRFDDLLEKFLSKTISSPEQDEFFALLLSDRHDDALGERITHDYKASIISEAADLPPHIAQEIIRNILQAEKKALAALPQRKPFFARPWRMAAAAAVLAFVAIVAWFIIHGGGGKAPSLAALIPDSTAHYTNAGLQPRAVQLADGSVVTLQPQATLHYPVQFSGSLREVYLEGDAFFDVAPDARRPFYVYYNRVVTKVLGTTFNVGTNPHTGNVEVEVQTGRVQVYENEKLVKGKKNAGGLIITPNQKAIYKTDQGIFEATLAENPQPIDSGRTTEAKGKNSFVFEHTPLEQVFKELEARYAIEIVVENESIYRCVFSGDISRQDLYGKLKFICLTTNADYEINGTRILIKGKGCN
ncbi:MAG: FecR domain-containing protein [Bacteroidetes bacterium]|nr:FecR domain-containing protein [Bacteroidota bacterium]